MKTSMKYQSALLAVLLAAGLAGCQADSDIAGLGGDVVEDCGADGECGTDDDNGAFGPNDGSVESPIFVDSDGDGIAETPVAEGLGFVCEARAPSGSSTIVGSGGLVGGPLTDLLNLLGGDSLTSLLNSVTSPDNVIDGQLSTFATFTTTLGGLGLLNSVDLNVLFPGSMNLVGSYAVFGISFPGGTVDLSLADQVTVSTFLGSDEQEQVVLTRVILDLLGQNLLGGEPVWFGLQATKNYDRVAISVTSALLSVNVGEQLHVHELCPGGRFVTPPTG
ncbi:hypothetical protein [Sinimarinibacterium flocculans]|uniref:Lipoprotein n=1 Tax=Sinimarinibacterium flocculans TaxID=985250 RepID=A0A318ED14_9GAMM|nr:hypothetical protein [Sinimarinibacterium flocculans]PXV70361.1 hypothetical protein C8D93_102213 [Sinimarinibacterium flocculans]